MSAVIPNPKTFDESLLWDTANKLRGTVESSEYKHVVLSLIFLKFASDKFAEREQELIDARKVWHLDAELSVSRSDPRGRIVTVRTLRRGKRYA